MEVVKRMKKVNIYPNTKKSDMNHQTVGLIPHVSKIILKIIQQCLNPTVNRKLLDVKAVFFKEEKHMIILPIYVGWWKKQRDTKKTSIWASLIVQKCLTVLTMTSSETASKDLEISSHYFQLIQLIHSVIQYSSQAATVRTEYGEQNGSELKRAFNKITSYHLYTIQHVHRNCYEKCPFEWIYHWD